MDNTQEMKVSKILVIRSSETTRYTPMVLCGAIKSHNAL